MHNKVLLTYTCTTFLFLSSFYLKFEYNLKMYKRVVVLKIITPPYDYKVVTGSTDGIGKEYAKELAKRDINVILISRSLEKLETTRNEINSLNPNVQVKIIQADFSKGRDEIERIAEDLNDVPVGILVNNVGKLTEYPMYFGEISRAELWDMININIGATTLMTHLVLEKMKNRRKGAIVNVSSASDAVPVPLLSFYAASKTLVRYLSDAIRVEYSRYGLTVQTLSPYYIDTKMVRFHSIIKNYLTIIPDASTYASNAVNTLGKLNISSGYWVHDVLCFIVFLAPKSLITRISYIIHEQDRNNYVKSHKQG